MRPTTAQSSTTAPRDHRPRIRSGAGSMLFARWCGVPGGEAHAQLASSPWPMFGHDLQHTGRSPYVGPGLPAQQWAIDVPGRGGPLSPPTVAADGTIYVGVASFDVENTRNLRAINPDGTLKWSFDTGGDVYSSPAVAADGTVYVSVSSPAIGVPGTVGSLYAVNGDGTLKWAFPLRGNSYSSPAVAGDGTIYVGAFSLGGLHAVNPDGTPKWSLTDGVVR